MHPLMRSSCILDIILTAKNFNTTPADILGIDINETYLRYCVNDACSYLYSRMQPDENGKREIPIFDDERNDSKKHNPGLDLLLS